MFEFEQETVNSLLSENANFKRLYDKYCELKQKVKQANERTIEMDEFALEEMKKEITFKGSDGKDDRRVW